MKFSVTVVLMALCTGARGAAHDIEQNPVGRVVGLLRSLQTDIESDGKTEQMGYDKYACWIEGVTKRKIEAITAGKVDIADAAKLILRLAAEIATGSTSIKNLADDIAENKAAQKEALEKREEEHKAFVAENKDNIASQRALREAVKVLDKTGTGSLIEKGKFLGTIQQAQVLGVVGGLRKMLQNSKVLGSVSEDDITVVQNFVDRPANFLGAKSSVSAAQVSQQTLAPNPFGDYAPQSTRIQGILKGMLESFSKAIRKQEEEEAAAVKAYKEVEATRKRELATLVKTKMIEESSVAKKKTTKADTEEMKQSTEEEVAAAEAFLEDAKQASRKQATEWSERSRLRAEELLGINEAIQILSTPSARKIFRNATTTFLQLTSSSFAGVRANEKREKAYRQLQKLAAGLHSLELAKMAVMLKQGGHFDQVIAMIDKMMELLRREEAADISHRDRCQSAENANTNEIDDLNKDISDNNASMIAMNDEATEVNIKIADARAAVKSTKTDMESALDLRNKEHAQFVQALKDDTDAIALIEKAIVSLSKYYINNKLSIGELLQRKSDPGEAVYSISEDDMPTADVAKADKHSSQSGGIISVLTMIKQDLEKEVTVARQDEATAESDFDAYTAKLQEQVDALEGLIAALEEREAGVQSDLAAATTHETMKNADLDSQNELKVALYNDCFWVKTHFESRATKRKTEMSGLTDAKAFLSGIDA